MADEFKTLEVYKSGPLTVVGFGGEEVLDKVNLATCRSEIVQLLEQTQCKVLAFDLTGVRLIPSSLLGLLASLRRMGIEVHLYNPSDDVREVLEVTQLITVMPVHYVDVKSA